MEEEIEEKGAEEAEAPKQEEGIVRPQPADAYKYNPEFHRFSEFLGVDRDDRVENKTANQISVIYDWGKEVVGKDDRVEVEMAIKQLMNSLGIKYLGKELINRLYQYIRLDTTRRKIEKEMSLLKENANK